MKVALLGLGNVGKAVFDILACKLEFIDDIEVKYVLVRNIHNKGIDKNLLVTDYNIILNDSEIDVVVEMMGSSISYQCIKDALLNNKHVVTANKEVIASSYLELQKIAIDHKVKLLFEASVGGGIPIVHTLLNSQSYNDITNIQGILNGTTNFILSSMQNEKISFAEALLQAQELGFAEADPTADLEGLDMVRKIAILSMIAYKTKIDLDDIYHYGIANIDKEFVEVVELLGYKIKFLAESSLENNEVNISVQPVIVKTSGLLANVDYEYNVVTYLGNKCERQMMYGKGAGPCTANSIVFDLGLVFADYKQKFYPKNNIKCVGNLNTYSSYLIKYSDKIDSKYIDKEIGSFVITKELTGKEFNSLKDKIAVYARIME